jgi:hypothetical protein
MNPESAEFIRVAEDANDNAAVKKERADLNGDGAIDMLDVAEFSQVWLQNGSSEADFNQDSRVNFSDWVRMAENWQNEAIWYYE